MSTKERAFITAILSLIAVMVTADLITDANEGVHWSHLLIEGTMALAALIGVFLLIRGSIALRRSLAAEQRASRELQAEAERWRAQSRKYLTGLSQSIDSQLTAWNLTEAEKEVAFLLLKGLSLKEIAAVRNTSEKTARTQSMAIYSKSGLTGRSELSAFFLEDLLVPQGGAKETQGSIA